MCVLGTYFFINVLKFLVHSVGQHQLNVRWQLWSPTRRQCLFNQALKHLKLPLNHLQELLILLELLWYLIEPLDQIRQISVLLDNTIEALFLPQEIVDPSVDML